MPPKKAAPKKAAAKAKSSPPAAQKRARGAAPSSAPPRKKTNTTAGAAASATAAASSARPAVDEHCSVPGQVYLDANGVTWAVKLNQTNIGHNNNKFYIIQVIEPAAGGGGDYACFTRWGRVGESGQSSTTSGSLAVALKAFASKFKDKTKNDWSAVAQDHAAFKPSPGKYDLVETDVAQAGGGAAATGAVGAEVVQIPPSKLDPALQAMLTVIFNKNMFREQLKAKRIDDQRMPLGKLTRSQVERGYAALEAIEAEVNKAAAPKSARRPAKSAGSLEELSSRFYTIIPHDFGRDRPVVIDSPEKVKEKYDLLNLLNDIQIAVAVDAAATARKTLDEHPLDKQYKELGCQIEVVDPSSKEFEIIRTYTTATQGCRRCRIRRVFRVDRRQDFERMDKSHGKEKEGRLLLWHGTNVAVVAAILKTGLRIMPHAGGRVGRGLYLASENGKSSAYVQCNGKTGIMFLVEACMGDAIHKITRDDSSLTHDKVAKLKATSVLACGRVEPDPAKNISIAGEWGPITVPQGAPVPQPAYASSSFAQSEYLVYEESRARIKYLLEMEF